MGLIKEKRIDHRELEVGAKLFKTYPGEVTTTVTQITNRSTGVTLNSPAGQITTDATSLAAGAEAKFVVTNSFVTAKSVVIAHAASGQTADTSVVNVVAVASGSFTLQLTNLNAATADTGAMVINFAIIDVN